MRFFFSFLLCHFLSTAFTQPLKALLDPQDSVSFHIRNLVLEMDTTFEDRSDHYRPDKGIIIHLTDNLFRIMALTEYKNKKLNGIHMTFYLKSNMPEQRGKFINGMKDGEWYYWKENGTLSKKETWTNGKLLKRKVIVPG